VKDTPTWPALPVLVGFAVDSESEADSGLEAAADSEVEEDAKADVNLEAEDNGSTSRATLTAVGAS
jgi:hypothetical protein